MKTAKTTTDEMLAEYDFSQGVRGKYAERFRAGTNVVLLDPDLADRFPDSAAVNRALRALLDLEASAEHPAAADRRGTR